MQRLFRNVASNYSVAAVEAILLIIVTPVVVQSLGIAQYSVWIILRTLGYYLGFLDLGLPDAQVRQHARLRGSRGSTTLRGLHGTSLVLFLGAGVAGLIIVAAASLAPLGTVFGVSADTIRMFPWLLVAMGVNNVFVLLGRGIDGIYYGEERFDAVNVLHVVTSIAKAVFVCTAMLAGFGLTTLIVIQILFGAVGCVLKFALIPTFLPQLELPRLNFDRASWRSVRNYSIWNSLNEFMTEGTAHMDKLLIPIFLSSALVGPYALIITMAAVVFMVGEPVASTYLPMFSRISESGSRRVVRSLFFRGSRLIIVFTLPASVVILLFGNAVLDLWIGAEYTDVSESILWLTVANFFFSTCLWTPLNVLMASGRIKEIFWISVGEVSLVVMLIVLLVPAFGLPGLAVAGLIANLLTGVVFFIPLACRQVGAAPLQYAVSAILVPLLTATPLLVVAYLLSGILDLSRWIDTLLGSVLTGVLCLAAILIFAIPRMERLRYYVTVRQLLGNAG